MKNLLVELFFKTALFCYLNCLAENEEYIFNWFRVFWKDVHKKQEGPADTATERCFFHRDENIIVSRIKVPVYRDKKNIISR